MAESSNPRRVINATAPIRICDLGGWTDTWFAETGAVFNIGVYPYAEVQIYVTETPPSQDRRTAVEIVMGHKIEKELYNLEKDLERGWHRIVFCAVDQDTLDQLRQMIEETLGSKMLESGQVHFMRLRRFLE